MHWLGIKSKTSRSVASGGGSPDLIAQGIEKQFPNPKIDVAETGKRQKLGLFTGPKGVTVHLYCKIMEQHWSKRKPEQGLFLFSSSWWRVSLLFGNRLDHRACWHFLWSVSCAKITSGVVVESFRTANATKVNVV
jgi:hypothetical protein